MLLMMKKAMTFVCVSFRSVVAGGVCACGCAWTTPRDERCPVLDAASVINTNVNPHQLRLKPTH